MMYHPADYTTNIKREVIEGEIVFVARVAELPDLEDYADTFQAAYELICETIELSQAAFIHQGLPFPAPKNYQGQDWRNFFQWMKTQSLQHSQAH